MLATSPQKVSFKYTLAIANFIAKQKQQEYSNRMQEAMSDMAFVKRTMDTQRDFETLDEEGLEAW